MFAHPRAFLPSDLDSSRALCHAITATALATARGIHRGSPGDIAKQAWPHDRVCAALIEQRGAATVATTSGSGWTSQLSGNAVVGFVLGLQGVSAASRLFAAAVQVSLEGRNTVTVPRATTNSEPVFVTEGSPIP